MRGVYLYAIAREPPPAGLMGLRDTPVEGLAAAGLVLWVSRLPSAPKPALNDIQGHNGVIESGLGAGVDLLPVRFGQWAPGTEELTPRVLERRESFLKRLEELAGTRELGVRLTCPADGTEHESDGSEAPVPVDGAGEAPSGRAYLERLARRVKHSEKAGARVRAAAERLRATLGEVVREERVDPVGPRPDWLNLAHLVHSSQLSEYRDRLEIFRAENPEVRLLLSGPWPPYSFVT